MSQLKSPFLAVPVSDWLCSNDLAFAIFDGFPVSPGHILVTTRRIVETWFDATDEEQAALMALVKEATRLSNSCTACARNPIPHRMKQSKPNAALSAVPGDYASLLSEVTQRVRSAQIRAAMAASTELLALHWDIGA